MSLEIKTSSEVPGTETPAPIGSEAAVPSGGVVGWLRGIWHDVSERLAKRRAAAIFLIALVAGFAALVYTAVFVTVAGVTPDDQPERTIDALFFGTVLAAVLLLAIIGWVVARFFAGERRDRPGSRLSANLIVQFVLIAALPIGLGALLAGTLFLGIESWFSERTQKVLVNSRDVAQAYLNEHQDQILSNVRVLARYVDNAKPLFEEDPQQFTRFIASQAGLLKLLGAYVVNSQNEVLAGALDPRVDTNLAPLPPEAFQAARERPIVTPNADQNQVLALIKLELFDDAYLFASRRIDPRVPELVAQTEEAFTQYRVAEQSRFRLQWVYGLTFLGMALLVCLIAILQGLRSAKRIAEPLSTLVVASERVSRGDLAARVSASRGDDEVATLGRAFNRMTGELQAQRNELVEANRQYDQRRRFIEAVMAGVTAGVIGLDAQGTVTLTNRSARVMLGATQADLIGHTLREVVPEMAGLVEQAKLSRDFLARGEVDLTVDGHTRNLLVRVTSEPGAEESGGTVVTFDDITELVAAQRTSAWADVARRIAHEIKNPLTPIQLSAERLRRKYAKEIETQPEVFEQCTQTIIRQVGDMRRMVDEFSSFARMPEAVMKPEDIGEIIRQAAFLERVGHPDVTIDVDLPETPVTLECDGRQVNQALINVVKNAAEAVGTRLSSEGGDPGVVLLRGTLSPQGFEIAVIDNGCGLPKDDRHRLTEPYMTTRTKGTGLGLAIVKKIMEDHGGALRLSDAPLEEAERLGRRGAMVRLVFPTERVMGSDEASEQEAARAETRTKEEAAAQT